MVTSVKEPKLFMNNNVIPSVELEHDISYGRVEPLTKIEVEEIESEFSHYPKKQAATIEALKVVQKYQGWVSDGKIKAIAQLLEVSPEAVDGVATFYNKIYRRPVGGTVISLCDSVSCWIMGYERLREYTCQKLNIGLGETSADGRFTLLPTPCLGACDKAPAVMNGDELVVDVTEDKIDQLIESTNKNA